MIFDFHTHIFPPEVIQKRPDFLSKDPAFAFLYESPSARIVDAEELLKAMDQEGVDRAMVCGFPWEDPGICQMANEYLLDAQKRYPGRLVSFYTPSPAGGKESVPRAEEALQQGMMGIGEVAFYTSIMGKDHWDYLESLAEVANRQEVPFLLHVNESVGHVYPGKMDIRLRDVWRFVEKNPDLILVLAHWGGGLFFYELMKSVKKRVGRLYYDTAASPFLYSAQIYRIAIDILGPERILFGSDYPLIRPTRYLKELDQAGLPPEVQRKILGQNALSLFPG